MSAIAPPPIAPSEVEPPERVASPRSWRSLIAFGVLEAAAGMIGKPFVAKPKNMAWYRGLSKPRATPPGRTFGIVWPVLYAASAVSAWRVWRTPRTASRTGALALWGAQLVTNAAWTPLFFGAKRTRLALADLGLLAASLAGFAAITRKVDRTATWLTMPYLAWVGFAGYLNASIATRR
jgi:translocator protein